MALLWGAGVRFRRGHTHARHLATPVISVGGITMGGTGKTPFVVWLAGRLNEAGLHPGVLTRGYRRQSRESVLLQAAERVPVAVTGDEPQIFLRAGVARVGIGADRFEVGRRMEERFQCGVFLLDDGFQHWRLARSLDIVLIDALDPLGGAELFPLGRLREPLDALARAGIFVITRAQRGVSYGDIVSVLREYNPRAPVFTSRVVPQSWEDPDECGRTEPPCGRAAAFCGLANPDSFWRTLASLEVRPVRRWTFRDHHRYSGCELRRMAAEACAAGADALLTTQKDAANLCQNWRQLIAPLRLLQLRIGLEVDNEQELLRLVQEKMGTGSTFRGGRF